MFNESIFSYCISEKDILCPELPQKYKFGKYTVNTDLRTPYQSFELGNRECVVFGYAVDVISGERTNLPKSFLEFSDDIDGIVEYEKRLGGKYIVLYRDENNSYILGDATTSIPIYYSVATETLIVTNNPEYICKTFDLVPDVVLQKIRDSGDLSQAMPCDVTQYKEIKQLVPNHFLCFESIEAVRFVNSSVKQKKVSVSQSVKTVKPMIEHIVNMYMSEFDVHCPITAGRDSRVVLAFLEAYRNDINAYTIVHKNHKGNEQDLTVPVQLCRVSSMNYEQLCDIDVPESVKKQVDMVLGKNNYSHRTLEIAYTIRNSYPGSAIISGDLIGQIGKCSLHRDIPLFLATPRYFRCKLHNYSKQSLYYLRKWMEDIKCSGECVNVFDLFSVENRMGRWAGQTNLVYNSIGQAYLNIFNSRSIIYNWTCIERSERMKSMLHVGLIDSINRDLLTVPFEQSNSFLVRLSKLNCVFYYLASFAKFYAEKLRFRK